MKSMTANEPLATSDNPAPVPESVSPNPGTLPGGLTPENLSERLAAQTKQSLLLPVINIADIVYTPPEYLVDQLVVRDTVGFISASPGSTKTWLAWDLALSIATGTPALGVFESKRAAGVLAFNAEDSPGAITKPRLSALASSRGLNINTVDTFKLINTSILMIDDSKTQSLINATIGHYRPSFVLLDPFRQVHSQNEDKASDMAPILSFLRQMQREHGVTIYLVCHERKQATGAGAASGGSGGQSGGRRADRTRGSNALEGWRDTAIYMDKPDNDKKTHVQIYHRGYIAPEPFFFELEVKNTKDPAGGPDAGLVMASAELRYVSEECVKNTKLMEVCREVYQYVQLDGPVSNNAVCKVVSRDRNTVFAAINAMIDREILVKKGSGNDRKLVVFEGLGAFCPEFLGISGNTTPF